MNGDFIVKTVAHQLEGRYSKSDCDKIAKMTADHYTTRGLTGSKMIHYAEALAKQHCARIDK